MSGDASGFIDACGETAIRSVTLLAKALKLKPEVIDYKNSFDAAPDYCSDTDVVDMLLSGIFNRDDAYIHVLIKERPTGQLMYCMI